MQQLLTLLRARRPPEGPYLIGITGSVAVGKSTLARTLSEYIAADLATGLVTVSMVPTDCFLFPNAVLEARGLTMEKGFPASYDVESLRAALGELRASGGVAIPAYDHRTYDIEPDELLQVAPADVVIADGLHLTRFAGDLFDVTVHLDARESVIEEWYVNRFRELVRVAREDAESFYRLFVPLSAEDLEATSRMLWSTINLVNLREHIEPWKSRAHVVVELGQDHEILAITST